MKKIIFMIVILFSTLLCVKAQDVIIKTNGEELKVTIASVLENEIEYKRADNINGPSYKIAKADVVMIIYSNGSKEFFSNAAPKPAGIVSNANTSQSKVEYGIIFWKNLGFEIEVYCGNKEKEVYPGKINTLFSTLNMILNKLANEGWEVKSSNEIAMNGIGGSTGIMICIERKTTR